MSQHNVNRRRFLQTTVAASAAATTSLAAPSVLTAKKTDGNVIVGEGDYRYEVNHAWPQLPDKYHWQTTHNVAVDSQENLYVIHEGHKNKKDHPSIFVFDKEGRFVRAFGAQFQGGGHGLEVRKEGNQEFLYVCAYQDLKTFAKLDLMGEEVWRRYAPVQSGVFREGEENPSGGWGRNRFLPTNFAFLPDGDFFLVDGYGSYTIHRYDKDGTWKSFFGGPGKGQGKFNLPHGIWIDARAGRKPQIVICDRAHHTLQYLTLDGKYIETLTGYGLPANADTYKDLLLIPELHARITLLDAKNQVVARLGDDADRIKSEKGVRNDAAKWNAGKFRSSARRLF